MRPPVPDRAAATGLTSMLASTSFGQRVAKDGAVPSTHDEAAERLADLSADLANPRVETVLDLLSSFNTTTGVIRNPTSEPSDELTDGARDLVRSSASSLGRALSSVAPDWSVRALWSLWTQQHVSPSSVTSTIEDAARQIVSAAYGSPALNAHKFAPGLSEHDAASNVAGALERAAWLVRRRVDAWVAAHPSRWSERDDDIVDVVAEELGDIANGNEPLMWRDEVDDERVSVVVDRLKGTTAVVDETEVEREGVMLVVADASPVASTASRRVVGLARRDTDGTLVLTEAESDQLEATESPTQTTAVSRPSITVDELDGIDEEPAVSRPSITVDELDGIDEEPAVSRPSITVDELGDTDEEHPYDDDDDDDDVEISTISIRRPDGHAFAVAVV
ncbi:hypothetical protein Q5752_000302 [Cryptotrichosporon argae]